MWTKWLYGFNVIKNIFGPHITHINTFPYFDKDLLPQNTSYLKYLEEFV